MSDILDAQAWELILECWMQFFEELCDVRCVNAGLSGSSLELHSEECTRVIATYIWVMGKAIKIQEDFVDEKFKDHPVVSTVINYHLLQNSVTIFQHDKDFKCLEKKGKELEDKLNTFNSWKSQTTCQLASLTKK